MMTFGAPDSSDSFASGLHDGSLADKTADHRFVENDRQLRSVRLCQPVLPGDAARYLLADLARSAFISAARWTASA